MNCACSRDTRWSVSTRSRSVRRPTVKGKWSITRLRRSVPSTTTSTIGSLPVERSSFRTHIPVVLMTKGPPVRCKRIFTGFVPRTIFQTQTNHPVRLLFFHGKSSSPYLAKPNHLSHRVLHAALILNYVSLRLFRPGRGCPILSRLLEKGGRIASTSEAVSVPRFPCRKLAVEHSWETGPNPALRTTLELSEKRYETPHLYFGRILASATTRRGPTPRTLSLLRRPANHFHAS